MSEIPVISVEPEGDSWRIVASSYGRKAHAGERLFRAQPWPKIEFSHEVEADARRDAATLTDYITRTWPKKVSRDKIRRQGE
jgi:hypothetical protein